MIKNPFDLMPDQRNKGDLRTGVVTTVDGITATIKFAGESEASIKKYKCLESYTPTTGDYVLLGRISGTYIIIGKVG